MIEQSLAAEGDGWGMKVGVGLWEKGGEVGLGRGREVVGGGGRRREGGGGGFRGWVGYRGGVV